MVKIKTLKTKIKTYFKIDGFHITIRKEIFGGFATFLAMSYILVVQPGMMSSPPVGLPFGGIYLATIISSFAATFMMGLFARIPISLAPGMGLNAFFAYTVCSTLKIEPYEALSVVLVSGWLYFGIALTPARKWITNIFPKNVKLAIGVAIGIFIGFVGLQQTGIIQSDAFAVPDKATGKAISFSAVSVQFGNLKNPLVPLAIFVLLLMIVLHFLKIPAALIISMIIGVIAMAIMYAAGVKVLQGENTPFQLNDFNKQFNDFGKVAGQSYVNIGKIFQNPLAYIAIFVFLYTDFFDTTGTLFVLDKTAGLSQHDKRQVWLKKANIADATGTVIGASLGSSTVTSYMESQVGISQGARTGLAAITTSALFLLTILTWPIMKPLMPVEMTPGVVDQPPNQVLPARLSPVVGPSLVVVGIMMVVQLKDFDWKEKLDLPVLFMTILLTVLSYSISTGIATSVVFYTTVNLAAGFKNLLLDVIKSQSDATVKVKPFRQYFSKTNVLFLILFVVSITYFGTMVLYTY